MTYGLSARTVLVVDDDLDTRRILRDLLEYLGFLVEEAEEANVAFKLAVCDVPRLVIENYPTMFETGHTLTRALRTHPATSAIPILNLTSRVTARNLGAARLDGVSRSLAKPVDLRTVTEAIRSLVSAVTVLDHPRKHVATARGIYVPERIA
jgi:CheY-like chemotaxis protein